MKFAFSHIYGALESNAKLALSWDAWKATLRSPWSAL